MRAAACLVALCVALLVIPSGGRADTVLRANGPQADVPDFDAALPGFVGALLHLAIGPGPLRSVTADSRAVTLRFVATALTVPEGGAGAAMVVPLGERLVAGRVQLPVLRGSGVTYAMLAAASAPGTTADIPLLADDGAITPLPKGFPGIERADAAGYRVPRVFAAFVSDRNGSVRQPEDVALAGEPLREPVWVQTLDGPRLVQPFTRRVLVWDPETNSIGAAAVGEAAAAVGMVSDGGTMGALLAAVMTRLADAPPGVGVALQVGTPRGSLVASWDGAHRYSAASVIKLAIMAAYEDAIARGDLPRDPDTDTLEEDMIVYSDNDSANSLIDLLGHPRINAVMQRLGMTDSIIGSHIEESTDDDDTDDNYLVPRESLLLMDALVRGDIGDVARIRDLLSRSQAPGSVRDAIAPSVPLYEKRGWYDGVENDVLLVAFPNGTWLTLAIFQSEVDDIDAAYTLFDDLTVIALAAVG
jgi:beta-lactamase class A